MGIDSGGRQFVLPVQAKGGADQLSVTQTEQDMLWCAERLHDLICRPVLAQFGEDDLIALFEVTEQAGAVKVVQEKHYRLVASDAISPEDLRAYRQSA